MNTLTRRSVLALGVLALTAVMTVGVRADRQDELQERFKSRFGKLQEGKAAGKIGETTTGVIDPVDAKFLEDDALRSLVEEENADRRELYKLIAEKERTTEGKVAERAAARNFQRAKSGEYLKDRDGKWKRKQ